MHNKIKNLIFLFALLFILIYTPINIAKSQDKGIKLTPTIFQFEKNKGEKVQDKVKIDYINFTNPDIQIFYKEFDKNFQNSQDSSLLLNSSNLILNRNSTSTEIDFTIDTNQMADKTYFFGYQIIFNNLKSSVNINEKLSIIIPIILTVNKSRELADPKPLIVLNKTKDFYFDTKNVLVNTEIGNSSEKVINFSGELIFLNNNDEIFYSQKISGDEDRLLPKQVIQDNVNPDFANLDSGILPYFGKVKVFYRGVVNNTRHIQTNSIEFYVIPYKLIFYIILFVIICIGSFYLVRIPLKNSKN